MAQARRSIRIRDLKESEVEFLLEIEDEESAVRGHFATDEPDKDRELEEEIVARLARGDTWAWCTVKVTAIWNGMSATDTLGCCSYEGEEDFTQEGGYYADMKAEALNALNKRVREQFVKLRPLMSVAKDSPMPATFGNGRRAAK